MESTPTRKKYTKWNTVAKQYEMRKNILEASHNEINIQVIKKPPEQTLK